MRAAKKGKSEPVKAVKKKEEEKPVMSGMGTDIIRAMIPDVLPGNAQQLIASTITGDNKYGWEDMSTGMQEQLARSVINARTRTGKNSGGTQYRDYSDRIERDINNLDVSLIDGILGSYMSPDFKAATTMGRVSYTYNPETDTYYVYDSYDFNQVGDSSTAYGKIRKMAGEKGVQEGKPNLVATFKGSDYENIEEPTFSYGNITDKTDAAFNAIKNLFK